MTADEVAELAGLTVRTVHRYVRAGVARPRRVPMARGGYRMDFQADDIDRVLIARDQKRRRLEIQSPALARSVQRRTGGVTRGTPRQRPCPHCGR
jgi:DNA-binding transcriptional MerR regulator